MPAKAMLAGQTCLDNAEHAEHDLKDPREFSALAKHKHFAGMRRLRAMQTALAACCVSNLYHEA